jgi:hypothetical protein
VTRNSSGHYPYLGVPLSAYVQGSSSVTPLKQRGSIWSCVCRRTDIFWRYSLPFNGEINLIFGAYTSVCCGSEIVIPAGSTFPDCPNHSKLTTKWKSVADEPIRHATDLKNNKKEDAA